MPKILPVKAIALELQREIKDYLRAKDALASEYQLLKKDLNDLIASKEISDGKEYIV